MSSPGASDAVPALAPAGLVTTYSSDADEQARALGLLDQHYEQLSCGRFSGSLACFSRGGVSVFRESLSQAVFQAGCSVGTHLTFATASELPGEAYWNGRSIGEDTVVAFVPGREFSLRTPRLTACVGVSIDAAALEGFDSARPAAAWQRLLARKDCWADRRARGQRLEARLARWFDTLPQPQPDEAGFAQRLDEVLEDLLGLLERDADPGRRLRAGNYPRIARRARALMLEQLDQPLRIHQLCEQLGCSRRALQYAFAGVFGLNPLAYFRSLRLAAARRALLAARGPAPVQEVALALGFNHLPRFARDYQQMFGELPSQSLARGRWHPVTAPGGRGPA